MTYQPGIRPEVLRFARIMERKLREGEAKRGPWKGYTLQQLLQRAKEERDELYRELWCLQGIDKSKVLLECADYANTALMIADVIGGLMECEVTPDER